MFRAVLPVVLTMSTIPMLANWAAAQEEKAPAKAPPAAEETVAKPDETPTNVSAVSLGAQSSDAFALPKEIQLSAEQQQQIEALKKRFEPMLAAAEKRYEGLISRIDEDLLKDWRNEFRADLRGANLSDEEQAHEIERLLQQKQATWNAYARKDLVIARERARQAVRRVVTPAQWAELDRMDDAEMQKYLASCQAYQQAFQLPEGIEPTDEQKEKVESLKQQMAKSFALAEKRYQNMISRIEEAKVEEWRDEIRAELQNAKLSDEEIAAEVERQIQQKRASLEAFARGDLVAATGMARVAVRRLVTPAQWAELDRMDDAEMQKYLASCQAYTTAFALPEGIELTEQQREKLEAAKQQMARSFAEAQKRYQELAARIDEAKLEQWRDEILAEYRNSKLSDEQIAQYVDRQIQKKQAALQAYARKDLVALTGRAQAVAKKLVTPEQWAKLTRMDDAEVQKHLEACQAYAETFEIPQGVELSDEQKEKLEELKGRVARPFAEAYKRYQDVVSQVDDAKLEQWRDEIRAELQNSKLSDEEIDEEVDRRIQEKQASLNSYARRELLILASQTQVAVKRILPKQAAKSTTTEEKPEEKVPAEKEPAKNDKKGPATRAADEK
ncbi:MAG: hypothetical protein RIC55_02985 [Pirellulaceae bacterium]